jgi:hypothetical protein
MVLKPMQYFLSLILYLPITVATRAKAWNVFALSNTGIVGSNSTRDMDVCVRLFCVYAVLQAAALRRADPPSKESYRSRRRSRNWKSAKVQQKAVEL